MSSFNPKNWYWIVGGDESRFWSSAKIGYVHAPPNGSGISRIANEVELNDVLLRQAPSLAMTRSFTPSEVMSALYRIDAGATGATFSAAEIESPTAAMADRLRALAGLVGIALGTVS